LVDDLDGVQQGLVGLGGHGRIFVLRHFVTLGQRGRE
jgi:hypothetical protein